MPLSALKNAKKPIGMIKSLAFPYKNYIQYPASAVQAFSDDYERLHIMKKTPLRFCTTVRPMIYSLSSAFALLATGTASANFADTPIRLQNKTEIRGGAGKVKPNVMLFVDDSGSMEYPPRNVQSPAVWPERSRMSIAKEALTSVVGKYQS